MDSQSRLSRRERQIMDIVYKKGKATVNEVWAMMQDPPGRTGVRTFMRILEEKGYLRHQKTGREYRYNVVETRKKAGRTAFKRVLNTFFEGSLENALVSHLSGPRDNLSAEELDRLSKLIDEARKKKKV